MGRPGRLTLLSFILASSFVGRAEQWEVGIAGGVGKYRNASVTTPAGTAEVGFATQFAAGMIIGENLYRRLGGEFRYTYRDGDLLVRSGGQEASFDGRAHAIHYDLLYHATDRESKIRPFVAGGAGIKVYQGVGRESASQPLSRFAFLTKTDQVEPLISFGGGVKFRVSKHSQIRADFRDYVTPTPDHLFVPAGRGKVEGWLHDFVGLFGMSYVF
jgi:hypothetical protein